MNWLQALNWDVFGQLLLAVLLAGVGGMLLAFWQELRRFRAASRTAPLLAEQLATQMLQARDGLAKLRTGLQEVGPRLDAQLQDAGQRVVELKFLLERASQVAERLDKMQAEKPALPVAPPVQAAPTKVAKAVASENVASNVGATAHHDPIEDLLARLQHDDGPAAAGLVAARAKRTRSGITQAELDLQAKALRR
jgi:hypothetical protein